MMLLSLQNTQHYLALKFLFQLIIFKDSAQFKVVKITIQSML